MAENQNPEITMSESSTVVEPKLRAHSKRAADTAILAAQKAVAHHADPKTYQLPQDINCLERKFLARFQKMDTRRQKLAVINTMAAIEAGPEKRARRFNDLAKVNLRLAMPIAIQVKELPLPAELKLQADYLERHKLHGQILFCLPFDRDDDKDKPNAPKPQPADKLELRLHSVICDDQTDDALFGNGSDEIDLGGVLVNDIGQVTSVAAFRVSSDFDDGEVTTFDPPKPFAVFPLRNGSGFPKNFFATFSMVESDGAGAIAGFLNDLTDAVKPMVKESLSKGGAAWTGGGPGVEAIIKAGVSYAVDKVIDFVKSLWSDEILNPVTVSLSIPSPQHQFLNGTRTSRQRAATVTGHGANYRIIYDWRLLA